MTDKTDLREIGKKNVIGIGTRTQFPGWRGNAPDHQVGDQDLQRVGEGHDHDQDLLHVGELEQLQDTMCQFPKFLYVSPPVM